MTLNFRIPAWQYLADFALVPIYFVLATTLALIFAEPTIEWFGFFALGYAAWTLSEYGMHRWLFHTVYARDHGLHHIRPTDWVGLGPAITGGFFALLWLFCVSNGIGRGGMVFAGYVAGYYAYIVIHILIHHTSLFVAKLRATHEMHHKGASANFGVSTNFWDHVFRTYRKPV